MNWIVSDISNFPVIACGIFYSVLCIFSLVTGLIYAMGKRQLKSLELSEKTLAKLDTPEKMDKFARKMGWVTFVVGIVQGLTAFCFLRGHSAVLYWIAFGFNLFSIGSAGCKLLSRVEAFPLMKICFYFAILVILLLESTRALFF